MELGDGECLRRRADCGNAVYGGAAFECEIRGGGSCGRAERYGAWGVGERACGGGGGGENGERVDGGEKGAEVRRKVAKYGGATCAAMRDGGSSWQTLDLLVDDVCRKVKGESFCGLNRHREDVACCLDGVLMA
ncbi:hypothetical protein BUALT_Bualt07G0036200 [Buddleja alternifolia]|uniref:Uncharacterized protein n=1 Tax=Buddleja alternifolia TaxID=168488 RepID=A0AAV6XFM7_9LAMI|nr:hypothetical protein BUALT_Bualt07G0036200 [Buddleja alternifolia]